VLGKVTVPFETGNGVLIATTEMFSQLAMQRYSSRKC
jgi:hypothetical protein